MKGELIYEGSVKRIWQLSEKELLFDYSNQYSIFDWGEMPDLIESKGQCLAMMAHAFFVFLEKPGNWLNWQVPTAFLQSESILRTYQELKERGLQHHSLGLCDKQGKQVNESTPSSCLKIQAVQVITPRRLKLDGHWHWDYSSYHDKPKNALVPLEMIFRFGLPQGSSLLKRIEKKPEYASELGLSLPLKENQIFDRPILEYSSKLEPMDRYVIKSEAYEMAGLDALEVESLEALEILLALRMKDFWQDLGIELWDGKFEFAFTENRNFQLVDSIGPDEIRLLYKGVHISKELLRQYYVGSKWYEAIQKAKLAVESRQEQDWMTYCKEELLSFPKELSSSYKVLIENMYRSLCNSVYRKVFDLEVFSSAPSLQEWYQDALQLLGERK